MKVKYRKGYKYQLYEDNTVQTQVRGYDISTDFILLTPDGELTLRKGYAWDGASGPTIDSDCAIRGSLYHDGLYQLMREQLLPETIRKTADQLLRDICIEDGMWKIRAYSWYLAVRNFARDSCLPVNDRPVCTAP